MYETATLRDRPAHFVLDCAEVSLPQDWDGKATVVVSNDDHDPCSYTVNPALVRPLRRAVLLFENNLATRVDIGVDLETFEVISVYWED